MKHTREGEEIKSGSEFMHRDLWNSDNEQHIIISIPKKTIDKKKDVYFPEGELIIQAKIYGFKSSIDYKEVKSQNTTVSLVKSLTEVYNKMENSDVIIITKDGKKLKAHSLILRARSSVINKLLDLLANSGVEMPMILSVKKFDSVVVEEFLKFLYYTGVDCLHDQRFELYRAAIEYRVKDFQEVCLYYLHYWLEENVIETAKLAVEFELDDLLFYCAMCIET
jgi:BTB/POZ domain